MTIALVASPDGKWVVSRQDRELASFANGQGPAEATSVLDLDDFEVAVLGTPPVVVVVTGANEHVPPAVQIHRLPELDQVARVELPYAMRIASTTGARLVLLSRDGKLFFVRVTPRALALQPADPGGAVDLAIGLERDQALLGMSRKLEVWDTSINRPALRLQLQLPNPPRVGGAAKGHLWAFRTGDEDLYVYRLSDGRPFRHHAGAVITNVVSSLASPYAVIVTPRGPVRLNCFAHSLHVIDSPWTAGSALTLLGADEDVALVGLAPGTAAPWRANLARPNTASSSSDPVPAPTPVPASNPFSAPAPAPNPFASAAPVNPFAQPNPFATANPFASANPFATANPFSTAGAQQASPLGALHPHPPARAAEVLAEEAPAPTTPRPAYRPLPPPPEAYLHGWRAPYATRGAELAGGAASVELPTPDPDSELDTLQERFDLQPSARRTLAALYGWYLVGEAPSVARLAQAVGDWIEVLGRGELGALGFLKHAGGRVMLRRSVTAFLDGRPPGAVRIVAGAGTNPLAPGVYRMPRDSKPDAELEANLAERFGALAVVTGDLEPALLDAMLHGAVAAAFTPPATRPARTPSEARLVLVLPSGPTAWLADLPGLP